MTNFQSHVFENSDARTRNLVDRMDAWQLFAYDEEMIRKKVRGAGEKTAHEIVRLRTEWISTLSHKERMMMFCECGAPKAIRDYPTFNYCPMCGRRLAERGQ